MVWLITIGVVLLIFGALFIFSREMLLAIGEFLNKPVGYIDKGFRAYRMLVGIVLVIIGGWVISVAFSYPELWYLHIIGVVVLFFGLLYLFLPGWLDWLSKVLDQILLSTDEAVIGARKSLGIILIVVAIYVFYSAYLMLK
ncbi:MAG: hypothetical protein V3T21_00570 [Candidatus Margulisiibacteriota bacterium]